MKTTSTLKTVSVAKDEQELIKILKGMSVNDLLNDYVFISNDITRFNKEVKKLDKKFMITDDWQDEREANLIEEKCGIAEFLFERIDKALKNKISKIYDVAYNRLVKASANPRFEFNAELVKTKSETVAKEYRAKFNIYKTHINIICKCFNDEHQVAA